MEPTAPIPDGDDNLGAYAGWSSVAILLVVLVVELALLQALALAVATGIYHLVPLLDVGQPKGFASWLSLFQVVSPSLTLPGGAAIVLSTWLLARRAQRAEQMQRAAERRADAAEANAAAVRERAAANLDAMKERAADAERVANAARDQAAAANAAIAVLQAELERQRALD